MTRWSAERPNTLRADTTDVEPVVTTIVFRIQVRTIVFQVPAISTAIRVVRPPVPVPGIVRRTAVVVAACNWAKRCSCIWATWEDRSASGIIYLWTCSPGKEQLTFPPTLGPKRTVVTRLAHLG